ncbi:bacteriocin [Tepidibacter formicigenes]|jgi:bacteriocin-like protein|uniref:Bacteriocin-type signal sequence-containing protein n=1 Tax=Tepidibacter formicigenes DSM 15518 TaxID=1123349 RepID=A0A1M6UDN1_9FIRM|nr:bacteriocin [Tepidibacter formicigenes]SHK67286.1 bacteriocin-type signal sequence-containing protein [Tepidibacter formicigenes DSM 15518]
MKEMNMNEMMEVNGGRKKDSIKFDTSEGGGLGFSWFLMEKR